MARRGVLFWGGTRTVHIPPVCMDGRWKRPMGLFHGALRGTHDACSFCTWPGLGVRGEMAWGLGWRHKDPGLGRLALPSSSCPFTLPCTPVLSSSSSSV